MLKVYWGSLILMVLCALFAKLTTLLTTSCPIQYCAAPLLGESTMFLRLINGVTFPPHSTPSHTCIISVTKTGLKRIQLYYTNQWRQHFAVERSHHYCAMLLITTGKSSCSDAPPTRNPTSANKPLACDDNEVAVSHAIYNFGGSTKESKPRWNHIPSISSHLARSSQLEGFTDPP